MTARVHFPFSNLSDQNENISSQIRAPRGFEETVKERFTGAGRKSGCPRLPCSHLFQDDFFRAIGSRSPTRPREMRDQVGRCTGFVQDRRRGDSVRQTVLTAPVARLVITARQNSAPSLLAMRTAFATGLEPMAP
ncbi:hypothetical protein [Rhodovulum strictum]|uniref:Uncharacterized protein n=1 Tax=Rhodovulum strictum TaxID=58314 RepID=A0A844BHI9_9RHOB|nr:hypothetical protein [Rhodovulum strictum]MRH20423.1 hypothetical protein [Rhodovulum strictum]